MKRKYSVLLGILILSICTFLSTSYVSRDWGSELDLLDAGHYELQVKGEVPLYLEGSIAFESNETLPEGDKGYRSLNLYLKNEGNANRHFVDIYMSIPEPSKSIVEGNYRVSENVEGFFDDFKGVFGIADISSFGELPFFANHGQVTIYQLDKESITGRLRLTMSNTLGKIIELEGDFNASRRP